MKNDVVLMNQSQTLVLNPVTRPVARRSMPAVGIFGQEAVLAMQRVLVELSRSTGQSGAMDWLDYFVTSPDSVQKIPWLVLVASRQRGIDVARELDVDDLKGAVLLYEYKVAGRGTRVFATDDVVGMRTVIAPAAERLEVARVAMAHLLQMGAVTALISLDCGGVAHSRVRGPRMKARTRMVPHYLPLENSYEATLATLGSNTRRNFRRYQTRAEADVGTEYVAEVRMGREEFMEVNRLSTNPAPEAVTAWRYSLLEQPGRGVMFAGMRGADGRWLSLVGGRRHGDTLEIDWQMNLAGLPRYSLTTVMRAYLLEHEIERGTRKLVFQGGTPHPMRHSFQSEETVDLLGVRAPSARAWILRKFAQRIFPEKNFLREALRDTGMVQS